MNASFALYQADGVRVYFSEVEPDVVPETIGSLLSSGYTVEQPVPKEGERRYRITGWTKGSYKDRRTHERRHTINLWDKTGQGTAGEKMSQYPQLTIYPDTNWDDIQTIPDLLHLFPGFDAAPATGTQRSDITENEWQRCDLVAVGVPETNADGEVVHTAGGYVRYRFHHIEGAGTKPKATSGSEAGDGKPTTLKGALEYAKGLSIPAEAASAGMQRLVRDLFDVPQGQERDFLLSAENGKVDMVVQAYVQWADEWVEMAHHAAMEEQEIPF